jgi:4'-phosphopantetheinyl transferase
MWEAPDWNPGSHGRAVALNAGDVHVWRVPLERTESEIRRAREILSADEILRADRFYFQRDRDSFVAARGTLRELLGGYLKRLPEELDFAYGAYGKPSLRQGSATPSIHFNVSHSHGLALMVFSLGRELGIDVESIRPDIASEEIAERYFSPHEVAELRSLPPALRAEGFFLCWTRKEAYVKALGNGLQIPLKSFQVGLTPNEPEYLNSADSERWMLRSLRPAVGFVGAILAEGQDWELRCWDWTRENSA